MSTSITIKAFLQLLDAADAITVDEGALLTHCDISEVVGQVDNQVVHIAWVDDEGLQYSETLTEGGIAAGSFHREDAKFVCDNAEGDRTVIRFFAVDPLRQPGSGFKAAVKFVDELMDTYETFTGIADEYGTNTVVDLLYLQQAILKGNYIDYSPAVSSIVEVVSRMPSAEQWKAFINTVDDDE